MGFRHLYGFNFARKATRWRLLTNLFHTSSKLDIFLNMTFWRPV